MYGERSTREFEKSIRARRGWVLGAIGGRAKQRTRIQDRAPLVDVQPEHDVGVTNDEHVRVGKPNQLARLAEGDCNGIDAVHVPPWRRVVKRDAHAVTFDQQRGRKTSEESP